MENIQKLNEILNLKRMGVNSSNTNENYLIGLYDLIKYHDLVNKKMVEIGCFLGISTELFAMFCDHITSVDLWGLDNNYDGGECPKEYWFTVESLARKRLENYKNATLIRDFGNEVASKFEDNSLDLVYLDGNHSYESVFSDIHTWYVKLKPGGVMSGHDYTQLPVSTAVNEQLVRLNMIDFRTFSDTSWSMIKNY